MRLSSRGVVCSLCVGLLALPAAAGKAVTFESVAEDPKLPNLVKIQPTGKPSKKGEGVVPNLEVLEAPPKRVALVSFYVFDPGEATGSYYSSTRTFSWLTQDGASHFAQGFYEQGIDALREAFAAHGMTLLTADEFLDSDAKREAFTAYKLEVSMAAKAALAFVKSMAKAAGGDTDQSAVAAGYRLLATHEVPTDPKTAVSLNELRAALDVDALAIVKNGTLSDGKTLSLGDIHLMIYGPNPMQKIEGKRYIQWKEGQHYASATLALRAKPQVATFKKKAIESETYAGYEKLLTVLADAVGAHLEAEIAGK